VDFGVCMCVHTYVYVYLHRHTCIGMHIYIQGRCVGFLYVYMCACMYIYVCMYMYILAYIYRHTDIYIHIFPSRPKIRTCVHMHAYIIGYEFHTHTHMNVHINIYPDVTLGELFVYHKAATCSCNGWVDVTCLRYE